MSGFRDIQKIYNEGYISTTDPHPQKYTPQQGKHSYQPGAFTSPGSQNIVTTPSTPFECEEEKVTMTGAEIKTKVNELYTKAEEAGNIGALEVLHELLRFISQKK